MTKPPITLTPDRRYLFVVGSRGGRSWRATNPSLTWEEREKLTKELMIARRAVRLAQEEVELAQARLRVHAPKIALGERGPVWWDDGAPDLNRRLVNGTCYGDWWASLRSM
jgi:hypothetical protein